MTRWLFLLIFIIAAFQPVFGEENGADPVASDNITDAPGMVSALDSLMKEISDELGLIRKENAISAESLANTGISGEEATAVLSAKLANVTYGHSSLIISPENIVTAASPSGYAGMIGKDLGYQPETVYANTEQIPIVSNIFYLEEGFYGISISYPVFSAEQTYLGYTDITIRPEEFFHPLTKKTGFDVFILQPDGLTVYETNEVEIGKNVLTDSLYDSSEMRNVSRTLIDNQEGTIRYTFWNQEWKKEVSREAVWKTLQAEDKQWRIGVVRDLDPEVTPASDPDIPPSIPSDLNTSIANMVTFVKNASAYARTVGQDAASASFNNLSGPYVSGDRYIFAYDMNGTTLALPYQAGLVGKNRMDLVDQNGLFILSAMVDAAKRGGESIFYIYPNPQNNDRNQLKISYVDPVDSGWFIGAGIYLPWVPAELDQEDIDNLIERVKNARRHAEEVGKEEAIRDFNDLNQSFADSAGYIFAYNFDGTTLALPYQPEIVGTNRMDYTDTYGVQAIAQEISAAERGGGFVYLVYYNPDSKRNELKLCYVLPAGDDWLVGSGIYAGTDLSS